MSQAQRNAQSNQRLNAIEVDTFNNLQNLTPVVEGQRFLCVERDNAEYVLQPEGYVAQRGDAILANGRVAKLQIDDIFNVKFFGAIGDNVADDISPVLDAQSSLLANQGGTLFFPKGVFRVSDSIPLVGNMKICGSDIFHSRVKKLEGSVSGDQIFVKPNPDEVIQNISIENISIEGTWDLTPREGIGSLVSGRNINNVYINNVQFINGRSFAINFNLCIKVIVTNCRFQYICRDMCAVWNTPNTLVENNIFKGNDDDCISLNSAGFEPINGIVKTKLVVKGNLLEDCGGISVQSPNSIIITDNVLQRNKGNGQINLTADNSANAYETNPQSIIVTNNLITDILDRSLSNELPLTINNRIGIRIESNESTVPNEIADPYNFFYTTTGEDNLDPIRTSSGILISDNEIRRTLPAVSNYSEWGFGEMFTRFSTDSFAPSGFVDPEISSSTLNVRPVEIRGPLKEVTLQKNKFLHSSLQIIDFNAANDGIITNGYWRGIKIIDNEFFNCVSRALNLADAIGTSQDILIERNSFNLDPFFEAPSRQSDGSWSALDGTVAVFTSNVQGTTIINNIFKNCSSPYLQGDTSSFIFKDKNRFVGYPSANASPGQFNSDNKGVGLYPEEIIDSPSSLIYEDSDPASPLFGQLLQQPVRRVSGDTPPSSGFYFSGQIVWVNASNLINGFKSFAYRRLTTGTDNIVGVDWEALEANIS